MSFRSTNGANAPLRLRRLSRPFGFQPQTAGIAPDVIAKLKAAGLSVDYFEIDRDFGHSASGLDAAKWAPRLKAFMAALQNRS